jgi:hypothetical protein
MKPRQEAITAAFEASWGSIPEGFHVRAKLLTHLSAEDDEWLWVLDCVPDGVPDDEEPDPDFLFPGARTILGPDGRAWTMDTNPASYDSEVADRALARLYIEGVADLIDPETLAEQIQFIVEQRDAAIDALPNAVRRGEVRRKPAKD